MVADEVYIPGDSYFIRFRTDSGNSKNESTNSRHIRSRLCDPGGHHFVDVCTPLFRLRAQPTHIEKMNFVFSQTVIINSLN